MAMAEQRENGDGGANRREILAKEETSPNSIEAETPAKRFQFNGDPSTDQSPRTTIKGATKCDKHCELQTSVNQACH